MKTDCNKLHRVLFIDRLIHKSNTFSCYKRLHTFFLEQKEKFMKNCRKSFTKKKVFQKIEFNFKLLRRLMKNKCLMLKMRLIFPQKLGCDELQAQFCSNNTDDVREMLILTIVPTSSEPNFHISSISYPIDF